MEKEIKGWDIPGEYRYSKEPDRPKRVIDKEDFIYKMLIEANGMKYMYKENVMQCLRCVSYRYRVKCNESVEEVYNDALKIFRKLYGIYEQGAIKIN